MEDEESEKFLKEISGELKKLERSVEIEKVKCKSASRCSAFVILALGSWYLGQGAMTFAIQTLGIEIALSILGSVTLAFLLVVIFIMLARVDVLLTGHNPNLDQISPPQDVKLKESKPYLASTGCPLTDDIYEAARGAGIDVHECLSAMESHSMNPKLTLPDPHKRTTNKHTEVLP